MSLLRLLVGVPEKEEKLWSLCLRNRNQNAMLEIPECAAAAEFFGFGKGKMRAMTAYSVEIVRSKPRPRKVYSHVGTSNISTRHHEYRLTQQSQEPAYRCPISHISKALPTRSVIKERHYLEEPFPTNPPINKHTRTRNSHYRHQYGPSLHQEHEPISRQRFSTCHSATTLRTCRVSGPRLCTLHMGATYIWHRWRSAVPRVVI